MLLNLSNHPSSTWPEKQKETAMKKYGEIQDLRFPLVDPALGDKELDGLVNQYLVKVMELKPVAVHIMGEMTFTFRIITKLKESGIHCVASTTRRESIEDGNGKKTSIFSFVRFRDY